jgi:hypothetical protein
MTTTRTVTFEELQRLVDLSGRKAPQAMRVAMKAAVQSMLGDVVKNRMSGQYLGVVTGGGRRSVQTSGSVAGTGERVQGVIGSPLKYIKAHEQGFQGSVQVPAHTRRLNLTRVISKGKRAGERVKRGEKARLAFSQKHGRKSSTIVRAHTRQMNIRARRFLRDTVLQEAGGLPGLLSGGEPPFTRRVVRALSILALTGRLPKTSQLGLSGG